MCQCLRKVHCFLRGCSRTQNQQLERVILTVDPRIRAKSNRFRQRNENAGIPVDHNQQHYQNKDETHRGRTSRPELSVVHELTDPTQFQQPVEPEKRRKRSTFCISHPRVSGAGGVEITPCWPLSAQKVLKTVVYELQLYIGLWKDQVCACDLNL